VGSRQNCARLFLFIKNLCFLSSCDHIQWFQLLQLAMHHGYVTLDGCLIHWNKQKDFKVMQEPKRLCTFLPGPHCIIMSKASRVSMSIDFFSLIYDLHQSTFIINQLSSWIDFLRQSTLFIFWFSFYHIRIIVWCRAEIKKEFKIVLRKIYV